jgi:hypothetical protein
MINANDIARAVNAFRPDWPTSALQTFIDRNCANWPPDVLLKAFTACATATKPDGTWLAATPRYVLDPQWRAAAEAPVPQTGGYWLKEPNCYICGRARSRCIAMRDKEIRLGIPDPHDFESAEDAERNASANQIPAKIRTDSRIPDEPWLPEDLAAESQARLNEDANRPEPEDRPA